MAMNNVDQTTQLYLRNEVQFFCFRLDDSSKQYSVNIFKVREVIKHRGPVTQVTNHPGTLLEGLITVRNETMPLIDLKKWFAFDPDLPERDLRDHGVKTNDLTVMICDFSDFIVGVRIYDADRIVARKWSEVNQTSEMGIGTGAGKVTGNTKYIDGNIMQIVDVERMLVDVFPWIDEQKETDLGNVEKLEFDKWVLLAEDSPSQMKIMKKILDKTGVNHKDFVNGKLLLDYVFAPETDASGIGLIITDLEMPEASGFEVIKQMKADKDTQHIPIVVNSSMSGDSNREMAKKLNADGFVSKSNPTEIQEIMSKLLAGEKLYN